MWNVNNRKDDFIYFQAMEKYSRGWRGAPAKGVGRSRGARVQIPLSPFIPSKWFWMTKSNYVLCFYIKGKGLTNNDIKWYNKNPLLYSGETNS